MKKSVSIGEAKPKLCDLVEQARRGQTHIITVHNEPCAQIGPVQSPARQLTEQWQERRKNIRLNRKGRRRLTLSQLIRESRK